MDATITIFLENILTSPTYFTESLGLLCGRYNEGLVEGLTTHLEANKSLEIKDELNKY